MLKSIHWRTIAIALPIVFMCGGCFTVLPLVSPDPPAGGGPTPPPTPPPPPPVIIINNHFIPPLPGQDPPHEPIRPFDRHEPAAQKNEGAPPDTDRRISREGNDGSAGSATEPPGGRRIRK